MKNERKKRHRRARVTASKAVSRKSKGKVHEAATRVENERLCVRGGVTQTEENGGKREGVRVRVYVCAQV